MRNIITNSCIEVKPTQQTVYLGGKPVSISTIAWATGIDRSYLSRILRGDKEPTLSNARKIAAVLAMGIEELMALIDERKDAAEAAAQADLVKHYNRVSAEESEDIRLIKAGKPVPPRLPGLRLPA
jgi:transcriptional regulator with XRE-family HTH domain